MATGGREQFWTPDLRVRSQAWTFDVQICRIRTRGGVSVDPGSMHKTRLRSRTAAIAALTMLAIPSAAAAAGHHGHTRLSLRSPAAVSVNQGGSTHSRIRTILTNGSARAVSFEVTHLPAGVTAVFTPRTVKPGHSATLILTTTESVPAGHYALRVTAVSRPRAARGSGVSAHAASVEGPRSRRITAKRTISLNVQALSPGQATTKGGDKTGDKGHGSSPATGTGSTPTQANGSIPTHIETWGYDDGCNGGTGASPALVQQWLTYAESNCGPAATKAVTDCHANGVTYCTAIEYLDANKIYGQGSIPIAKSAQESWWLHQPGQSGASHRLTASSSWGNANYLDGANAAVDSWLHSYVQTNYNSFDGLMMDDTSSTPAQEFYGTSATSSAELNSTASVTAEHSDVAAAMTHTDGSPFLQIDNGLSVNPYLPTTLPLLNDPSAVQGLVTEGAPISDGTITSYYSTLLDDMSAVDHRANDFLVLLSYDPSGSVRARRVQAATVLLGYSQGHIVSWSDLEQNSSDLAVWPEEGIVPTQPIQTMAAPGGSGCLAGTGQLCTQGGHTGVQVAPGVYRREFKQCYNHGVAIGGCAAIVNDTGTAVTVKGSWLAQSYSHQITMVGGDVQSGGTVNTQGASFTAGSTSVPADDAALLSS
jgi:hypothetical protein